MTRYGRGMTSDPRAALAAMVTAFERHLEASASRRGEDDPTVIAAYDDLADAFATYDEALLSAYGEMTPLDIYDGADEDDSDEDEDDSDEDDEPGLGDDEDGDDARVYSGLGDNDYENEDR